MKKNSTDRNNFQLAQKEGIENDQINVASGDLRPSSPTFAVDPWSLPELNVAGPKWSDRDLKGKFLFVIWTLMRIFLLLFFIYLFICGLEILSSAFKLLGGKTLGTIFRDSTVFSNPIAKVMIACISTAIIQSSGVTTSMIVTIVHAQVLTVAEAIYLIMGANLGSTLMQVFVAFIQAGNRDEFRRAFACATLDDTYNWLGVLFLLPIEIVTRQIFGKGYLEGISWACIPRNYTGNGVSEEPQFLKAIVKPFTRLIVQINNNVIDEVTLNQSAAVGKTIAKKICKSENGTVEKCQWLLNADNLDDTGIGAISLIISLIILIFSLFAIVKVLQSLLRGAMLKSMRHIINAECPRPFRWLTDYCLVAAGAVITFIMQSSQAFQSALTPLAGMGVIPVEKFYALQNGANLGTTKTAVISALVLNDVGASLQIALCHFFFNLTSILLFFVIPCMRWPVVLSKMMGNVTYEHRWFSIVFLVMFFVIPLALFGLSLIHWAVAVAVAVPFFVILGIVITINYWQTEHRNRLPRFLYNWDFLPLYLRSLQPYDAFMNSVLTVCCFCFRRKDRITGTKGPTKK